MKKTIFLGLIALIAFSSCKKEFDSVPNSIPTIKEKPTTAYVADQSFKIIAYFSAGQSIDSLDVAKFKQLTHINYAFVKPTATGGLTLSAASNFYAIRKLAKENNVKFAVSVGAVESADIKVFNTLLTNPALRKTFITNIVNFAVLNDLDGIDIDLEYPQIDAAASNVTYTIFMKELATELHSWHKYLSAAVGAGIYDNSPVYVGMSKEAIEAMDFINFMAYDGRGYKGDPNHSSTQLAIDIIEKWITGKEIPKEKIVLGLPTYGRNETNASKSYRELIALGASAQQNSFEYNGSTYHYNGFPLIQEKTIYAKENANGIMFWELYRDASGSNSLIKAANDALGRTY